MSVEEHVFRVPPTTAAEREDILNRAFKMAQEEPHRVEVGGAAVHPSDDTTAELLRYDGEAAVLRWLDGRTASFPAREVVDPNRVRDIAMTLHLHGGRA